VVAHQHCLACRRKLGGFFCDERDVLECDLRALQRTLGDRIFGAQVECFVVPWQEELPGGGFGPAETVD
jgi:hypothetical protein